MTDQATGKRGGEKKESRGYQDRGAGGGHVIDKKGGAAIDKTVNERD